MKSQVRHIKEKRRFEQDVDGHVACVEYVERDGCLDIVHTYVPKQVSGQGIASGLVAAAYEYADSLGLNRRGTCPYAAAWLERHRKK